MQFNLNDYQLSTIEVSNDSHVETVLFLHGWLDNAASFEPLIAQMVTLNPRLRYIALDLPGHGYSSHAKSGFYPFHDYLDVLNQVITELKTPVHLVGHSMGALISSCYSAAFSEHVLSLTQIEGYGPMFEPEHNAISRLKKGIQSRQRIINKPRRLFPDIAPMLALRASSTELTEEQIAPIVHRDIIEQKFGWQWRHDPRLKADSLYRMSESHAKQVLNLLPNKNLLILGKTGFAGLPHHFEQHGNPNTKLLEIEGGHHCHISTPEPIARAFFELLNA
ncbi:alpha/beta fold hydrolase [Vibrio ishigakensis]|nr:alpha/beta hydrolase [Vibrio ishigakensis]